MVVGAFAPNTVSKPIECNVRTSESLIDKARMTVPVIRML